MKANGLDLSAFVPAGAVERHDIRHICPECGGTMASETGLILVQLCWACRGVGNMSNDEMDWYQSELYRRAAASC